MSLAMIHFCEFHANQYYKLASFSIVTLACTFLMLIFLRGHYFIDLFCAVIFGHFFFNFAERISYLVDTKIFGIPFHKRFPNFPKKCGYCKYPINEWIALNGHSQTYEEDLSNEKVADSALSA